MPLRFLIICLILTRVMLGWMCGPSGQPGSGLDGGCCKTTCCEGLETCDSEIDSLACFLCSACDGRVPALPPAHDTSSLSHHDWTALLVRPIAIDPGPTIAELCRREITSAQVPHGVAWIERLRPLVCVWTI